MVCLGDFLLYFAVGVIDGEFLMLFEEFGMGF